LFFGQVVNQVEILFGLTARYPVFESAKVLNLHPQNSLSLHEFDDKANVKTPGHDDNEHEAQGQDYIGVLYYDFAFRLSYEVLNLLDRSRLLK
jgi:hypothetical protein